MGADEPSDLGIVERVLETLEIAVLARVEAPGAEEEFRLVGNSPLWFDRCFGSVGDMLERSAFLEDFVGGEACDCWQNGGEQVESGIWEEGSTEGSQHYFEAQAFNRGAQSILVIALADERHRRERMFVQHVHDEALQQRRLARERQKKEILLDCIVHDLSSPLTTILMNIQHVGRQLERDDLRQSLVRAETQAERQRSLIRTIADSFASDLSSFETVLLGKGEGVDIAAVAGEMVDAFQMAAEKRSIRLTLDIDSDNEPGLRVLAETDHLARVFDNLLSNAFRQSPDGAEVAVRISERGGFIRTSIDDMGPELSDDRAESIFLSLAQRTGGAESRNEEGGEEGGDEGGDEGGLGLYFCKMTVELWGGAIGLEKRPGGGSRFWFDLPEAERESTDSDSGNEDAEGGEA